PNRHLKDEAIPQKGLEAHQQNRASRHMLKLSYGIAGINRAISTHASSLNVLRSRIRSMTMARQNFGNPVAVSDLAAQILDPVLRKRAGISIGLVQSWE